MRENHWGGLFDDLYTILCITFVIIVARQLPFHFRTTASSHSLIPAGVGCSRVVETRERGRTFLR